MPTKANNSEQLPPSPNEATIVRMGEWKEGQDEAILETRNLGPCIGLAIYEPETRRGFLLHDPLPQDYDSEYNRLEDHLRTVFRDQPGAFDRMRAWLAGGSPALASAITPDAEQFVAENRQFMVDAMEAIGIPPKSVQISWTPDEHLKAGMTLDCATGDCTVSFS